MKQHEQHKVGVVGAFRLVVSVVSVLIPVVFASNVARVCGVMVSWCIVEVSIVVVVVELVLVMARWWAVLVLL